MNSRKDFKKFAKLLNENRWTNTILFTVIIFAISIILNLLLSNNEFYNLLVIGLIYGPINYAIYHFYLNYSRRVENSYIDSFKEGFNIWAKSTGLYISINILTFLWTLLLIVPGIIKSLAYSQAFYILADNPEISVDNAIKQSIEMMKGHKMDLFILNLSFIGWHILGLLTLGIAYIYIYPYYNTTCAVFYENLKLRYESKRSILE